MEDPTALIVIALLIIAACTVLGRRFGVAAPLLLMVIGIAASFLPVFDGFEIDPEWIIAGLLPPLLYSAAVSMPAMNFRREFGAISGLSVLLIVGTALVLGVFFMLVIPDLGFAWGVALGAIISPTDAVATSIAKQTSFSNRAIAMLDGESLFNDATALVLLRGAIVAAASSFSFWSVTVSFVYSVAVAVAVGALVGVVNLFARARVTDPTVNTVVSFAVPFVASVPAEHLGASGLVAAVVAGIITGVRSPRLLPPRSRLSDEQNWRTVELVLESTVFLTMGLQVKTIVEHVGADNGAIGAAVLVACGALILTILLRAVYVAPLLWILDRRARRAPRAKIRLEEMQQQIASEDGARYAFHQTIHRKRPASSSDLAWFTSRVRRGMADLDYFLRAPLGWREGAAVIWAGMRGAVTVAAAQTLPENTPGRSTLLLIAFTVAALSLLVQGGSIGPLLRGLSKPGEGSAANAPKEHAAIERLLKTAARAQEASVDNAGPSKLTTLRSQRTLLLDARDDGAFDAAVLSGYLRAIDAEEIALEDRLNACSERD